MDETTKTGHHRSARERQRKGPMWGCLKTLTIGVVVLFALLFLVIGGGLWYVGTTSFEDLVRLRIEKTLETRLQRDVTIGRVTIVRTRPQKVILDDLRIANAPGGKSRYFATARQVEITGGIESFWGRRIKIGRIDIRDPRLFFEVFPQGSALVHNFPKWQRTPRRTKYDIYKLDIGTLHVTGGAFAFLDWRHDVHAVAEDIRSDVTVTLAENVYQGTMSSPKLMVRLQEYLPFQLDLRGGFRYTPGVLALSSIALRGDRMQYFLSGELNPLTEGAYDLKLTSQIELDRVREVFKVEKTLQGTLAIDGQLKGKQGDFLLSGGWSSPNIVADVYELAETRGKLNVTNDRVVVDVDAAKYGGGTIAAHYELPQYSEPYPMSVDLRYNGVSLEKLFSDWGVKDTGLRGGATGRLAYRWNKDKVLDGSGDGTATLAKNATAFSNAKYPIPLGGSADFSLDKGVIRFRRGELVTDASRIAFTGSMRIEDLNSDLALQIHSDDFAELDRAAYNFAHSADKRDYELLGLGGAGDIRGTVKGPLKTPQVVAHVSGSGVKYNDVLLGAADIDLRYDGDKSVLTFDNAVFRDAGGSLALRGTIAFPDRGPSPRFDLAIDAAGYDVARAMSVVELPFEGINGVGTGKLLVTGTPENGRVTFAGLTIAQGAAELRLRGDVDWRPGEGNVSFDLDIAARDFPVADIATFLDFGKLPVTGQLTGTLHIEGTKKNLEGAGAVTVRKGSVFGEPVDVASADLVFTQGKLRATNVSVTAPAGQLTGEAEIDLVNERFSYSIASSSINLSKLKALEAIAGLLGGNVTFSSTGAGTFENPELVVEATIADATLRGLSLPPGSPPPSIYLAIRGGRLVVRGNIADLVTIEGDGTVGEEMAVDGLVKIVISDIERALKLSPQTATLPAAGSATIELKLGGRLSPIEALDIDGSVPQLDLRISEHAFSAPQPLRFGLHDGRITFDQFVLQSPDSNFAVTGYAEVTGDKRLDVGLRGEIEAALLQLFVSDLRADGHVAVTAGISGTLGAPRITGSADIRDAQFRFAGFPQLFDDVNGTVVFRGDRIDIDSLRATVGGGTLVAGGSISVEGLRPTRARLTLQGTGVAIRYFEGLTVEGNFNLLLSGGLDRITLNGDVDVTRALYFKDFDFQTALLNVILSRRGVTPVVAANWQDRVDLRLRVRAPDALAVRNNIADVTGSAEIDVTGTLANPVVLGLVELDEGGIVELQNVEYTVVRGSINFQNPFRIDPYFDITLEGRVSGGFSEVESGPIDVTINLTGTIDRFTPTITSDPPASDITLFSLLGFGALGGPADTRLGAPSASAVGESLLLQSLFSQLGQRILPFVDSFTYDPGLLDTSADPGPKVTFERRLSNSLRLLVVYNLSDQKSRAIVEWQATPDWTVQFTRDEIRNEYRAEARFRRRYEGHWTWGGNRKPVTMFATLGEVSGGDQEALPPIPNPSPSTEMPADDAVVRRISFRADARFDTAVLNDFVELAVGEPLTVRSVQASIKRLFSTGDFRDIRVEATPVDDGGVAITFVLLLNYRVVDIEIEGLKGRDRARAERELSVRGGDVLSLNAVDRSAVAVQQLLNRLGYLEATVDPETTFERAESRADVIFHVASGPRATVREVVLEGDTAPFPKEELVGRMRRGPGRSYRLADAREDAERMANHMIRRDHRRADVRYLGHTYDAATDSVTLRYRAVAGPKVRVEVVGVPRSDVRRLIPFGRSQAYSEDAIDTAAENIVRTYQQRGYINAAVDIESELQDGVWVTTFEVRPGERFRLGAVSFVGNEKIEDDELRGIVETAPPGGFRSILRTVFRRPSGITRAQLSADRDSLESYYRLQGFSEARVATPVVNTDSATGLMTVEFPITEGPQTLVSEIDIEGIEQARGEEFPRLQLRPGQPLNPQLLREDLVALQTFYADRGNAEVQITPRPEVSEDKTSAKLTYVIAEGPQIRVDDVIVRGNTYTRTRVIERKAEIDENDPFSYRALLEAQRNLYRLGIFSRVDVQPEQAGTSVSDRNIVIQVEEGKNLTFTGSLGFTKQTDLPLSLVGSASIAHRNLFGTGRFLGLEIVASQAERQEAFLTFREPFIFNYDIPVQLTVFQSDEIRRGARIRQRGTFIEASKVARLQTLWSVRYEYRIADCVENKNIPNDLCTLAEQALIPGLDRTIGDIEISSITPTFFWDRRDDPLDPTRGFFTSAAVEYAFPLFAADAKFWKEFLQGSYYIPLSERTVLAIAGRLGFIQAGRDDSGNLLPVPLSERFVAGGDTTHRAYALDLLGTVCPDPGAVERGECKPTLIYVGEGDERRLVPTGGNSLALFNIEYRFPIFATVRGATFLDAGNVFADNPIDFKNIRYGLGAGIRYLSPVGPLRMDVGYKLKRQVLRFDSEGRPVMESPWGFSISIGYAF